MYTILLVDDEKFVRDALKAVLRKGGYTFLEAENYEQAKEFLEKQSANIDLILSDFNYPGLNFDNNEGGGDLLALLEKDYSNIPVIVMSGKPEQFKEEVIRRGLRYSAQAITKPITKNTFVPLTGTTFALAVEKILAGPTRQSLAQTVEPRYTAG